MIALHEAEDGLLARVRLPGGRIGTSGLQGIAAAAELGSGLVELTTRANLQIRGLPAVAAPSLEILLNASGLLPSRSHERVRNVLASPFAGRDPRSQAETDDVVHDVDRRLCDDARLAELSGRFLFAVDDGSGLALHDGADVSVRARPAVDPRTARFQLLLAGVPTTLLAPAATAAELALDAARAFLELRDEQNGGAWRLRELRGGPVAVAERLGGRLLPSDAPSVRDRRAQATPGLLTQRDGRVAVTALPPLGRLEPGVAAHLAQVAAAYGGDVRLSPRRTVTLVDVPARRASGALDDLAGIGLVVRPDSGWVGLSACAGLGCCAKAERDVRAIAARRAAVRGPGAPREHWTACGRRCGDPAGGVTR